MKTAIKIIWNAVILLVIGFSALNYQSSIYIFYQAFGQLKMLNNTSDFEEYKLKHPLNEEQNKNLELITIIKNYSVNSLGFKPTKNFTKIYDQGNSPLLWAVTASQKFKIEAFYWEFPIVGKVSYKGFFDEHKAELEKNKLSALGYDVDLRSVSAWSTLGWFNDPVLSNMLSKSKGNLCNLIFHELFHATYYAESSVDYNENLASFIAHKATLKFLGDRASLTGKTDSLEYFDYLNNYNDNLLIENHMAGQLKSLINFYDSISSFGDEQKNILKLKKLYQINSSLNKIPVKNKKRVISLQKTISQFKNAWFIGFEQYNGLQDSLETVFNKIYKSDIRKMVQFLK